MNIHPAIKRAYAILETGTIGDDVIKELALLEGADILDLVSLANKVRNKFTDGYHACSILNARSGLCTEDCAFCSQSSHHNTGIEAYRLMGMEDIVRHAGRAWESGIRSFGIVASGPGYMTVNHEFRQITGAMDEIGRLYPDMSLCASLGALSEETAGELSRYCTGHYNINIQTNPARYSQLISTTHNVEDRIKTIRLLKKKGIRVCSGGIIGLGETMGDRIAMALALRELDADVIPLNVLLQIPGTPMEKRPDVAAIEVARTFAIFRLIHPAKIIKFAAGRETKMKDFQGLMMLAGANGLITGGYLTTRGREVSDDLSLLNELRGFDTIG